MNDYRPQGFSVLPTVVKNLLIINGLFFAASAFFPKEIFDFEKLFALYNPSSEYFRPYQLVTHLFMHGNFMHLFSNMFALWMFGAVLENYWGPKKFLTYYIITGLGAAFLHSAINYYEIAKLNDAVQAFASTPTPQGFENFVLNTVPKEFRNSFTELMNLYSSNPNSIPFKENAIALANELVQVKQNIPTVGASGAVFGVLLAFGMILPNAMIYVFFFLPMKAKYFVILYGLFELYSGIQNNPGDNVAHFAHLGGMLFGFILIKFWQRKANRWY